ncbi:TonB-dependent receptor [Pseudomonas cichorii]|uniref:TonB-dependent receptor n=1 Tax=Pseudomonas cichorii TaxID=36746 RepID=UPI001C890573|nr:TonB-dependent receptor [Pseudomonas cichorii]MBX8576158.1 TonB-dependent receptor [Pseudomonas cichorii]
MPVVFLRRLRLAQFGMAPLLHMSCQAGVVLGLSAAPLFVASVQAEESARRSYQIPAGSLSAALTRFAALSGVSLSVDPALVAGRNSKGLNGEYPVDEGFGLLLQGSGLQLQPLGNQSYTLVPAPVAENGSMLLPNTSIDGSRLDGQGDIYAGGQVARSGSQGMLGDRDFMETPFNQTSYTSTTIKNQQARTLGDMVASDPSVRITNPAGGRFEQFSIRGFSLFNSDVSFGGLYGVLPTYSIDMEMVERVDILKGPGALLGGIVPRGSVGGNINIEPKRAGSEPLTEFTGSFASAGQFGGHVDIGRRFGENQRFGIRYNGVRQSGDTEWDHQKVEREASVIGLDWREDRMRMSLDLGEQERYADAPIERVEVAAGIAMPKAKDIRRNIAQPWTYSHSKDSFGALRGEFDLSDSVMVYAAAGARKGNYDFLRHTVPVTTSSGNFTVTPRTFRRDEEVKTFTVGARSWFNTGPVGHTLNISLNRFDFEFDNAGERYQPRTSNLYNPVVLPYPGAPTRFDTSTHTENLFTSIALADTLSFLDDRVLLTLGARLQRVEVDSYSNGALGQRYDERATSPAMGLVIKATDSISLYANYMEGLSQGETAPTTATNSDEVFAPYKSRQAEVGVKYDHGTFGTSLSVFRIEQPAYITDAQGNFKPDGELRNQGVELNMFGEPLSGVRLLGGVMLLDSEQTKTALGTFDGNRGTGSPEVNANLGVEWDINRLPGLTLTARAIHTGSQYLDAANNQKIDSWERYDVGGRYAFKLGDNPVTLRASVENVLDKTYWASAATSSDSAAGLTLSTPRTYLVSATVGF